MKSSTLQVRISDAELSAFRRYAEERGTTMSKEVLRMIRSVIGGDVWAEEVDEPAAGSAGGSRLIELAERQVELLEQLVQQGGGTPGRGEEQLPVVISEPLGVSSETEIEESAGSLIEWRRVVRGMDEPVAPPAATALEWVGCARDWLLDQGIGGGSGAIGELLEFWGAPEVGDGELKEALGELEAYEPLEG